MGVRHDGGVTPMASRAFLSEEQGSGPGEWNSYL